MKILTAALALTIISSFFLTGAFAGDNKYYSEYTLKHKLNDKFDVFFTPELRMKHDMGNPYYYQFRIGSTYHAHKNLDLAVAYRYIQNDVNGQWDNNDVQYVEAIITPKTKLGNFELSDANKAERRFIENGRDRWVYRNLVTIAYPAKIGNFEFAPYVSNEVYYDFEIDKVNLNWGTFGVNKKINKHLTLGIYYRIESARVGITSNWITNNILGTNVTVSF